MSHIYAFFGCVVYVPIAPPQRTQLGPLRRLSIYVGKKSPTIVRYLILDRRSQTRYICELSL